MGSEMLVRGSGESFRPVPDRRTQDPFPDGDTRNPLPSRGGRGGAPHAHHGEDNGLRSQRRDPAAGRSARVDSGSHGRERDGSKEPGPGQGGEIHAPAVRKGLVRDGLLAGEGDRAHAQARATLAQVPGRGVWGSPRKRRRPGDAGDSRLGITGEHHGDPALRGSRDQGGGADSDRGGSLSLPADQTYRGGRLFPLFGGLLQLWRDGQVHAGLRDGTAGLRGRDAGYSREVRGRRPRALGRELRWQDRHALQLLRMLLRLPR